MGRFESDGKRNQLMHSIEIFASYFNRNLLLDFKNGPTGTSDLATAAPVVQIPRIPYRRSSSGNRTSQVLELQMDDYGVNQDLARRFQNHITGYV